MITNVWTCPANVVFLSGIMRASLATNALAGCTDYGNIIIDIECAKGVPINRRNWLINRLRECTSSVCCSQLLRD